jgi:hypothetical protein
MLEQPLQHRHTEGDRAQEKVIGTEHKTYPQVAATSGLRRS